MNTRWLVIAIAGFGLVGADPVLTGAVAATRHKAKPVAACAPRPVAFSWRHVWFAPEPRPNGCAPAVFSEGRYIGQDPDINIRTQLYRQPNTGYTIYQN